MTAALSDRSARKRADILTAAPQLFQKNGYQGASVDQIADAARVSKQTVYKHFGDKRELLLAIVTAVVDTTATVFLDRVAATADSANIEVDLGALAVEYLHPVLGERVVQLRRLVIGEASRVPELAALYYDRGPARTVRAFEASFARLHQRGILHAPNPSVAAEHFAFLVVGRSIDQALFCGAPAVSAALDVDGCAKDGVAAFLAAHRAR